jgi:hypothetical protein
LALELAERWRKLLISIPHRTGICRSGGIFKSIIIGYSALIFAGKKNTDKVVFHQIKSSMQVQRGSSRKQTVK